MNVAHYFLGLPPLHGGGLMIYARDIVQELHKKKICNLIYLFPGETNIKDVKSEIKFYDNINNINIYKIVNAQFVSFSGFNNPKSFIKDKKENNYREFLKNNKIDVLHIHSLMGLPKELIIEAKKLGIKIIFSVHDYFGLCPKINLYTMDNKICYDYRNGYECVKCNLNSNGKEILKRNLNISYPNLFRLLKTINKIIKKMNWNRKKGTFENLGIKKIPSDDKSDGYVAFRNYYLDIIKNFDLIIFNSNVTKEVFSQYINLDEVNYKVIPVTHTNIKDNRKTLKYEPIKNNKITFLFMGYLDHKKGFFDLIKVFDEIKKEYSNWQLNIYGDYSNINIESYDDKFYKFYGKYSHDNLKEIFSNSSMIIIPSKCKETFGFIGLEAYSYGIPALVSENVGFSMVINENKNGIVYKESKDNIYLKKSIIKILEQPEILKEFNQEILKDVNFDNYLIENHTKQIIECYKSLID